MSVFSKVQGLIQRALVILVNWWELSKTWCEFLWMFLQQKTCTRYPFRTWVIIRNTWRSCRSLWGKSKPCPSDNIRLEIHLKWTKWAMYSLLSVVSSSLIELVTFFRADLSYSLSLTEHINLVKWLFLLIMKIILLVTGLLTQYKVCICFCSPSKIQNCTLDLWLIIIIEQSCV